MRSPTSSAKSALPATVQIAICADPLRQTPKNLDVLYGGDSSAVHTSHYAPSPAITPPIRILGTWNSEINKRRCSHGRPNRFPNRLHELYLVCLPSLTMRRKLLSSPARPPALFPLPTHIFPLRRIPPTRLLTSWSIFRATLRSPQPQRPPQQTLRRIRALSTFLSSLIPPNPSGPAALQTLRAKRVLPYPPDHLYQIIADIDSYRFFLPNCTASQVTAWTRLQPQTQSQTQSQEKWPALADLTVGWGPFTQSYTSRVYCVPGSVVEAVSGAAETTIPAGMLEGVGYDIGSDKARRRGAATGIFASLVTRWTVRPVPAGAGGVPGTEWTEVTLSVQFRFANPALGFAVGQLADVKVEEMVQAFENRARRLYKKA